jgi:hypothetical protein
MKFLAATLGLTLTLLNLNSALAQSISNDEDLPPATQITDPIVTPTPSLPTTSTPVPAAPTVSIPIVSTPVPSLPTASAPVSEKVDEKLPAQAQPTPSAEILLMSPVDPTPTPGPQPLKGEPSIPSNPAVTSAPVVAAVEPAFWETQIQMGLSSLFRGRSSIGPMVRLMTGARFGLGFDFGVSSHTNENDTTFAAIEYGVYGAIQFSPWVELRLLVGAESWTGGNGSGFRVGPDLVIHFAGGSGGVGPLGIYISDQVVTVDPGASLLGFGLQIQF